MQKVLTNIKKYLVIAGIIIFPVFILSGFSSPYFVPKEIFGIGIISLILIVTFVKGIKTGDIKLSLGKFDIGVLLLALVYIITSILRTPNKMEAFFYPGVTTFVLISVFYYFIINQFSKKGKSDMLVAVFASGLLLALSMLLTELDLFSKIPQLPAFVKSVMFSPVGGKIQSVAYLLVVVFIGIDQILKEKDSIKKVFFGVSVAVIILSAGLTAFRLLPGKVQTPIFPNWQTSWEVAVETLKQSPILGAGPANYLSAFNLYRPLAYNQSDLWQARFSSANNFYFTLFTETGLLGVAILVILLAAIYKKVFEEIKKQNWGIFSLVVLVLILAIMPIVPALQVLFMTLLAIFSGSEEKEVKVSVGKVSSIILASPVFVSIIILGFFGYKAVAGEIYYEKSLEALNANNAQNTYNFISKAISQNPYVDRYHAALSQIDLALANSIASKKDITDTDRSNITTLVQSSISEGKSTVTLNFGRSQNWEILAQVYRSIMNFADGGSQFALQTYNQAIALDPINPVLRTTLGGIYYATGDYDSAITAFQLAIAAKNDYANAHYNLAATYAAKKDYDKAITEMNTVLSLVSKNSDDYKTAQEALDNLKKQKPSTTDSTSENLTSPENKSSASVTPPIALPKEATPPAAEK